MIQGWSNKETEPPVIVRGTIAGNPTVNPDVILVEFDGGARHVPGFTGFGMGYGSFRYNGGKVRKVEMNRIMSANAAEIWTLSAAVNILANEWDPSELSLDIWGDSTIAIKWALISAKDKAVIPPVGKSKLSRGSSEEMKTAVKSLDVMSKFRTVRAQWHGRANSVKAFGH